MTCCHPMAGYETLSWLLAQDANATVAATCHAAALAAAPRLDYTASGSSILALQLTVLAFSALLAYGAVVLFVRAIVLSRGWPAAGSLPTHAGSRSVFALGILLLLLRLLNLAWQAASVDSNATVTAPATPTAGGAGLDPRIAHVTCALVLALLPCIAVLVALRVEAHHDGTRTPPHAPPEAHSTHDAPAPNDVLDKQQQQQQPVDVAAVDAIGEHKAAPHRHPRASLLRMCASPHAMAGMCIATLVVSLLWLLVAAPNASLAPSSTALLAVHGSLRIALTLQLLLHAMLRIPVHCSSTAAQRARTALLLLIAAIAVRAAITLACVARAAYASSPWSAARPDDVFEHTVTLIVLEYAPLALTAHLLTPRTAAEFSVSPRAPFTWCPIRVHRTQASWAAAVTTRVRAVWKLYRIPVRDWNPSFVAFVAVTLTLNVTVLLYGAGTVMRGPAAVLGWTLAVARGTAYALALVDMPLVLLLQNQTLVTFLRTCFGGHVLTPQMVIPMHKQLGSLTLLLSAMHTIAHYYAMYIVLPDLPVPVLTACVPAYAQYATAPRRNLLDASTAGGVSIWTGWLMLAATVGALIVPYALMTSVRNAVSQYRTRARSSAALLRSMHTVRDRVSSSASDASNFSMGPSRASIIQMDTGGMTYADARVRLTCSQRHGYEIFIVAHWLFALVFTACLLAHGWGRVLTSWPVSFPVILAVSIITVMDWAWRGAMRVYALSFTPAQVRAVAAPPARAATVVPATFVPASTIIRIASRGRGRSSSSAAGDSPIVVVRTIHVGAPPPLQLHEQTPRNASEAASSARAPFPGVLAVPTLESHDSRTSFGSARSQGYLDTEPRMASPVYSPGHVHEDGSPIRMRNMNAGSRNGVPLAIDSARHDVTLPLSPSERAGNGASAAEGSGSFTASPPLRTPPRPPPRPRLAGDAGSKPSIVVDVQLPHATVVESSTDARMPDAGPISPPPVEVPGLSAAASPPLSARHGPPLHRPARPPARVEVLVSPARAPSMRVPAPAANDSSPSASTQDSDSEQPLPPAVGARHSLGSISEHGSPSRAAMESPASAVRIPSLTLPHGPHEKTPAVLAELMAIARSSRMRMSNGSMTQSSTQLPITGNALDSSRQMQAGDARAAGTLAGMDNLLRNSGILSVSSHSTEDSDDDAAVMAAFVPHASRIRALQLCMNEAYIHVSREGPVVADMTIVVIRVPSFLRVHSGDYVKLRCPVISGIEYHPFTALRLHGYDDDSGSILLELHVSRKAGGWTHQLQELALAGAGMSTVGDASAAADVLHMTARVMMDVGPAFGSAVSTLNPKLYDVVLCVSIGSGFSPVYAVLERCLRGDGHSRSGAIVASIGRSALHMQRMSELLASLTQPCDASDTRAGLRRAELYSGTSWTPEDDDIARARAPFIAKAARTRLQIVCERRPDASDIRRVCETVISERAAVQVAVPTPGQAVPSLRVLFYFGGNHSDMDAAVRVFTQLTAAFPQHALAFGAEYFALE